MFCTKCGFKLETDAKFCAGCGAVKEVPSEAIQSDEPMTLSQKQSAPTVYEAPAPPMYDQYVPPPYAPPSAPKKKSRVWIPITAIAAAFVLIIGVLFFVGVFGLGDDYDAASEDSSVDSVIDSAENNAIDSAIDIDGQPLAAEGQGSASAFLQEIEEQVGVLRKGEIPPVEEVQEPDSESVYIHTTNEWVEWNVTSFEHFGGDNKHVILHFELINNHEFNISVRRTEFIHNGEVFGGASLWLEFRNERIIQGSVIIYEREALINVGDIIAIRADVSLNDYDEQGRRLFDQLGRVEFQFEVDEISQPGSYVTNPGHIYTYDDLSFMISKFEFREETDTFRSRANVEFLMINNSDYETVLDQVVIYHNGTQLTADDHSFFGLSLHTAAESAHRRTLNLSDIQMSPGDTLVLRGRLRTVYDVTNITQETIEFSFVI